MAWIHHRDKVNDCPSKLRSKCDSSKADYRDTNDHEVADGSYNRSKNVISHRILKISGINRGRLRPPKHWNAGKQGNQGKQNRPEGIDVPDRIQGDAPQHTRGRVTAAVRHPGVRRLMHTDGEQKHDQLKQNVNILQGHAEMSSILTCGPALPNSCTRRAGALPRLSPAAARGSWSHNATGVNWISI